jgi:hypothetical protein
MVHKEVCVNGFHWVLEHRTDVLTTTYRLTYCCDTEDVGGSGGAEEIESHDKQNILHLLPHIQGLNTAHYPHVVHPCQML